MKMPIFLPHEMETEVFGNGHGFICITQKDGKKEIEIPRATTATRIFFIIASIDCVYLLLKSYRSM
jgi:hypothetical protein